MTKTFASIVFAGTILTSTAFCQDAVQPPAPAPKVEKSKVRQQSRIAEGRQSGQLTTGEAKRIEHQEGSIQKQTQEMRADNGGQLSGADKAEVRKEQKHVSKHIERAKHNDKTQ